MSSSEIPVESKWLFNRPSPGIVENWFRRNEEAIRANWPDPWVLDGVAILHGFFEEWDGTMDIRYSAKEVRMVKRGEDFVVPSPDTELWQMWQEYTNSEEGKADFNGSKLHLHGYSSPLSDRELRFETYPYDWHRLRTLGMGLRDGLVPEHYRDDIMPVQTRDGFVFTPLPPNNTNPHTVVITKDNHLVLTTRSRNADFEAGNVSVSIEEQMNGQKDNSPFETVERAVRNPDKLRRKSGEELRLTLLPESVRLGAIMLEPDCNCAALLMVGRCEEVVSQIDETVLGPDRAEFDYRRPVWTMPLEDAGGSDLLAEQFYHPTGFNWHGSSRARIIAALAYAFGYDEAIDRLYRQYIKVQAS